MTRLTLPAGTLAACLLFGTAAHAEVTNLECKSPSDPDGPVYPLYWVDFDKNVVSYGNMENGRPGHVDTYPAQISDSSISFQIGSWHIFIDRKSGENTWAGGMDQRYICEKGNVPLPAPPPNKF